MRAVICFQSVISCCIVAVECLIGQQTPPAQGGVTFPRGKRLSIDGMKFTQYSSVGATIFSGDRLSTDQSGGVQVRAGAARFLLHGASMATFSQEDATPAATLALGTATFSTANSKAFALHVASAVIRPNSDRPTIGQVTVLSHKELIVKSTGGSLSIAVEDDVLEIPDGAAYRIVRDPNAADPQGPRGAGTKGYGGPPRKPAKDKFIWYAVGVAGAITVWAVHEALESPDRP